MRKRKRTRTSQYRGVTRAGAKWRAAIRINNIKRELGVFEREAEAARWVCTLRSTAHSCYHQNHSISRICNMLLEWKKCHILLLEICPA